MNIMRIHGSISALKIEELCSDDGKVFYHLEVPLIYEDGHKIITVPAGFETDFASVPRLPIIFSLWGNRAHREAVVHDYLYSLGSIPDLSRSECDKIFRDAMILQGNPWWIYQPMYWGVRMWGWKFFKRRHTLDRLYLYCDYRAG